MQDSYSITLTSRDKAAIAAITDYVAAPSFPCVGARSAFNKERVRFGFYGQLGGHDNVAGICSDLRRFSEEFPSPGCEPVSFVAMFDDDAFSELQFDRQLWQQLQAMHAHDLAEFAWDPSVSADPTQPDFSYSVAGRAFFVVGLNPAASRMSRRSPIPCLVFNFHDQFEGLRASGKYAGMQKVVRRREVDLQGSTNPVLSGFGDESEARQYSGRAVDRAWKCPFYQLPSSHEA